MDERAGNMDDEEKRDKKKKTGRRACLIQTVTGVCIALFMLFSEWPQNQKDQIRAAADAFGAVALLFLCVGSLLWVSTTGFFDIFGFAVKRAMHALIPGLMKDTAGNYYEYRENRALKRRKRPLWSTLLAGMILLAAAVFFTVWWCL